MKVLFDNNMPCQLRRLLRGHEVRTAKEVRWTLLENGDLLRAAEASGFDVMITGDKNLSYQQKLSGRRIALVVLITNNWNVIRHDAAPIGSAVEAASLAACRRSSSTGPTERVEIGMVAHLPCGQCGR